MSRDHAGSESAVRRVLTHMPQLDGLRAIAVMLVLVSHFGVGTSVWLLDRLDCGRVGVRLFFVLSGFLITRILIRHRLAIDDTEYSRRRALWHFYVRRILRIFPVFYLTIAVAWTLDCGGMRDVVAWHLAYLSNLGTAMFTSVNEGGVLRDPTSAHFWSLAVEEQFYLFWPALVLWCPRRLLLPAILGMIGLAPIWRAGLFFLGFAKAVSHLPTCFDTLGAGALLALYQDDVYGSRRFLRAWVRPATLLGFILLAVAYTWRLSGARFRPYVVVVDLGLATLGVVVVAHAARGMRGVTGRLLQRATLRFVGKISYGIYVFHAFMSPLLDEMLKHASFGVQFRDGVPRTLSLYVMTMLCATLSWFVLERPIGRMKDGLSPHLQS